MMNAGRSGIWRERCCKRVRLEQGELLLGCSRVEHRDELPLVQVP
jgi:hypothetical protein